MRTQGDGVPLGLFVVVVGSLFVSMFLSLCLSFYACVSPCLSLSLVVSLGFSVLCVVSCCLVWSLVVSCCFLLSLCLSLSEYNDTHKDTSTDTHKEHRGGEGGGVLIPPTDSGGGNCDCVACSCPNVMTLVAYHHTYSKHWRWSWWSLQYCCFCLYLSQYQRDGEIIPAYSPTAIHKKCRNKETTTRMCFFDHHTEG